MVDPYEFIVRESVVSSSQEDVLKRIPGWDEHASQALLSRLHGSDEESEPAPASAFCMQEPLEWASPDTQACCHDNDSYNPAFESDRSRSLSPHAHYGDLWGSRLITQSQNGADKYTGIAQLVPLGGARDLLLVDEAAKKRKEKMTGGAVNECRPVTDVPLLQAAEAGFELGNMSSWEQRHVHFQSKSVALGDTLGCFKQSSATPSRGISDVGRLNLHSIVYYEKDSLSSEMLDGNCKLQSMSEVQAADVSAFIFDQTSNRKSLCVAVDEQQVRSGMSVDVSLEAPSAEEAMVRPRTSSATAGAAIVENVRKRKDEGDCAFAKFTQKLKSSKEPNIEQQHSKLASEKLKPTEVPNCELQPSRLASGAYQYNNKETQLKNQLGGEFVSGSSDTKYLLPFVSGNEKNISAHRMEKISKAVIVRDLVDDSTDCTLLRLFPESVMDVVMLVSEVLPTPCPDDPDLLSIVMSAGVSLPLPFRDCIGRFICNKSTMS